MQTRDPIDSVQLDGVRPSWWVLGGSLAVYGVLAAVLFRAYLYHLNPDGVSYISIAEKYLRGDWQD
ncbi:MAG TPA: hypothetical protein VFE58_03255, partial [Tepidisphaeraceae bacterium]|nr:hypothetical protein [Tepidisphaeraceae bacterium]